MKTILIMHPNDNIGNAIDDIAPGDAYGGTLEGVKKTFTAVEAVPFAFKVAIKDIPKGSRIVKYGEDIGEASKDIKVGECVHVHNVVGCRA